jgi:hypothetical protein
VALWAYSRPGTDEELEMKKRTTRATTAKTMYRRYLAAIVAMGIESCRMRYDGKRKLVVKWHKGQNSTPRKSGWLRYLWRRVRGAKAKVVKRSDLGVRQSLTSHIMNGKKQKPQGKISKGRKQWLRLRCETCAICIVDGRCYLSQL